MIKSEIALRIEMVEELLKKGQIKTAQEYFNILNQRQLMPMQKFKKGDKVTIKYKMIATSIEGKEAPKVKAKSDDKMKSDSKAKTK